MTVSLVPKVGKGFCKGNYPDADARPNAAVHALTLVMITLLKSAVEEEEDVTIITASHAADSAAAHTLSMPQKPQKCSYDKTMQRQSLPVTGTHKRGLA